MTILSIDTEKGVDFKGDLTYGDCENIIKACMGIIDNMLQHMQKQILFALHEAAKNGVLAQDGNERELCERDLKDSVEKGINLLYANDRVV